MIKSTVLALGVQLWTETLPSWSLPYAGEAASQQMKYIELTLEEPGFELQVHKYTVIFQQLVIFLQYYTVWGWLNPWARITDAESQL